MCLIFNTANLNLENQFETDLCADPFENDLYLFNFKLVTIGTVLAKSFRDIIENERLLDCYVTCDLSIFII